MSPGTGTPEQGIQWLAGGSRGRVGGTGGNGCRIGKQRGFRTGKKGQQITVPGGVEFGDIQQVKIPIAVGVTAIIPKQIQQDGQWKGEVVVIEKRHLTGIKIAFAGGSDQAHFRNTEGMAT